MKPGTVYVTRRHSVLGSPFDKCQLICSTATATRAGEGYAPDRLMMLTIDDFDAVSGTAKPRAGTRKKTAEKSNLAAAYVRMSTEHQQYSTSNQMDVIREFAKRRGLEIVKEYSDEGKSGLNIQGRDSLAQMISDVQDGRAEFTCILVYDISRWGRFQDADESAYYEYVCRRAGVRSANEEEGPGYDLVCGQGRIEAFQSLGYTEIPAVVVEISKEERLLRSLAENMARRNPAPGEILTEVERLKKLGLTLHEISARIDVDTTTISGLLALKRAGEQRLLDAALSGRIPIGVAVEIARTEGIEMQRELLKACESKQLTQAALKTIRRVMDRRRLIGKQRGNGRRDAKPTRTSAESLVNVYRRESQKQRLMVKKTRICEAKLLFAVTALRRLMADEHFVTLLRAEDLASMPKDTWERVSENRKEAV